MKGSANFVVFNSEYKYIKVFKWFDYDSISRVFNVIDMNLG